MRTFGQDPRGPAIRHTTPDGYERQRDPCGPERSRSHRARNAASTRARMACTESSCSRACRGILRLARSFLVDQMRKYWCSCMPAASVPSTLGREEDHLKISTLASTALCRTLTKHVKAWPPLPVPAPDVEHSPARRPSPASWEHGSLDSGHALGDEDRQVCPSHPVPNAR